MRVVQPEGAKGSLKWMQRAVEFRPELLQPDGFAPIEWLSPRREDDFAEYRDATFLKLIGYDNLAPELRKFWPSRGPQWDALGLANGNPVLIEAKAHIHEMFSPACAAKGESRARIEGAFSAVQAHLRIGPSVDWTSIFYQIANRVAHLWWLHQCGVKAELLFVGFLNDFVMEGPGSSETWIAAKETAFHALGLGRSHKLAGFIHQIHPDVSLLN